MLLAAVAAALLSTSVQSAPIALFNGKDLSGWHMDVPELDNNPGGTKPFLVRNGVLVSLGTPGGHLITDKTYRDYKNQAWLYNIGANALKTLGLEVGGKR